MQIKINTFITPTFKQIKLNEEERQKSSDLIDRLSYTTSISESSELKTELLDVFKPHLNSEIEAKKAKNGNIAEIAEKTYLYFFNVLKSIGKSLSNVDDLTEEINFLFDSNFIVNNTEKNTESSNIYEIDKNVRAISEILEITPEKLVELANENKEILSLTPETLLKNIEETASLLQLDSDEYRKMLSIAPRLMSKSPESISERVEKDAEILGITREKYIELGKINPRIYSLKPKFVEEVRHKTMSILQMDDTEKYTEMVSKHPFLLITKSEVIEERFQQYERNWGVSRDALIRAGINTPQFLTTSVNFAQKNIIELSKHFGMTEKDFMKCAMKNPAVLTVRFKTVIQNIENGAKALGVSFEEYSNMAKVNPNIYTYQEPLVRYNLEKYPELLEIDKELYRRAVIKNPFSLTIPPKSLIQNKQNLKDFLKIKETQYQYLISHNERLIAERVGRIEKILNSLTSWFETDREIVRQIGLENPQVLTWPEEYLKDNIVNCKKYFNVSNQDLLEIIKQNPRLLTMDISKIDSYLKESAKALKIKDFDSWKQAAKRNPKLATIEAGLLSEYAEINAWALGVSKEKYVQMGIEVPQIFTLPASLHYDTLIETPKLLGIKDKNEYREAAIKNPIILLLKPEVMATKIKNSAELLNISVTEMVEAALKNPQIFTIRPDDINSNIEDISIFLGIPKEQTIDLALHNPAVFSIKAYVVEETFNSTMKALNLDRIDLLSMICRNAQVLSLNTDVICSNIDDCIKILGLKNREEFLELAKENPKLLSILAKVLNDFINVSSKFLNISRKEYIEIGLKHPKILSMKPGKNISTYYKSILRK